MPSPKQIEANRLNARKSTGPRSAEGKAASKMNALRTGIDAQSAIVPGESTQQLETLTAEYHQHYHPVTPEQRALVDVLVESEWTMRRMLRVESQLWECSVRELENRDASTELGQAFAQNDAVFARLQRRIDSAQRNYHKALQQLRRLAVEVQQTESLTPEIGFVPQIPPRPTLELLKFPAEAGQTLLCDVLPDEILRR